MGQRARSGSSSQVNFLWSPLGSGETEVRGLSWVTMLSRRGGTQAQVYLDSEPRTPPLLCNTSGLCVRRAQK